ncbi:eukaryotic translation initiation factor 2A (IFA2A) [Vairimorpha necatrix]|uniref:Eukaryotic translation initiation factor 2A (IFA2A) n=1 Tax=Vairimorpha necatrix TaxID=6039 RepID=A0AAX4J8M5_9MICR
MPVLAHSSNDLILDIFDKKITIKNVDKFVINNNILVYNVNDDLYRFDLSNLKALSSILKNSSLCKLSTSIHELKLSKNGSKIGLLLRNLDLFVFSNSQLVLTKSKINSFNISDNLVGYETDNDFILQDINTKEVIHKSPYNYQSFFVFNEFAILATTKRKNNNDEDEFKLYKVDKEGINEFGSFNSLVNIQCKSNSNENFVLLNLSTSYVKNSYFASTILYLYDAIKNTFLRVNKLTNILDFTFISDGFCVVYGNQPSYVTCFDYEFNIIDKFPKGIRNRIYLNHQESYVVTAGFEQLAGNVEVFEKNSKEKFFTANELGASKIEWDTTGSYYYVSTLKYLKEDNRVSKYDYFGRLIATENFECLHDAAVFGPIEKFEILKKPEEKIVEKREEVYVPSILKGKSTFKVTAPVPKIKHKLHETEEELIQKISNIEMLKKRLENNEKLEIEELNLILNEGKIKKKLDFIQKNKK